MKHGTPSQANRGPKNPGRSLSYQFLPKALPGLRGVAAAQKQGAKSLPKSAVPQRLAGPSRLRPLLPIHRR